MKITAPTAFLSAGLLLSTPLLFGQDTPPAAEKPAAQPAPAPTPAEPAPEPEKPKMEPEKVKTLTSYGFGYRNGRSFANQTSRYGLNLSDLDREQFLKGLFDALELKDSSFDQEEINAALTQLSEMIKEREVKIGEENKAAGEKFLAENKKREGVITTESGLQYEILKEGDGEVYTPPPAGQRPNKQFSTIYRGTLIDGTEFDSSKGEPTTMSLNVIPGFKEALTTMSVGSKWRLYIPSELAYKDSRRSAVLGPNSTLIFDLELVALKDAPQQPSRPLGARPPTRPGTPPRAVSPPVRVPQPRSGARAVSPPVRIPAPPKDGDAKPVKPRIPTNPPAPAPKEKPAPKPE